MPSHPSTEPGEPAREITLRDGRQVGLRPIRPDDADEIVQAFERLSADSRYARFMQHKKQLDDAALQRGVQPRPGQDHVLVATVPAPDGIDIVGAAQYVGTAPQTHDTCEFAITIAEDWRGTGLARVLMTQLMAHARHDGYGSIEGWVMADNAPMLALAQRLGFQVEPVPDDSTLVRVVRNLDAPQPAH